MFLLEVDVRESFELGLFSKASKSVPTVRRGLFMITEQTAIVSVILKLLVGFTDALRTGR